MLADRRGSQSAHLEQMPSVRLEKRREPVAVGFDDQSAASSKEALKCVLRSAKWGLLAGRRKHRGEFGHREHGIGCDRFARFKDLLQPADMIMGRIVRIAGGHQPIRKAREPVGDRALKVALVALGKEKSKHRGLHIH